MLTSRAGRSDGLYRIVGTTSGPSTQIRILKVSETRMCSISPTPRIGCSSPPTSRTPSTPDHPDRIRPFPHRLPSHTQLLPQRGLRPPHLRHSPRVPRSPARRMDRPHRLGQEKLSADDRVTHRLRPTQQRLLTARTPTR